MAFTVTARQSGNNSTTAAGNLVTSSATPTANSLFIVAFGAELNTSATTAPVISTPTGGSLTYTLVDKDGDTNSYIWGSSSGFRTGGAVYRATVGGSPSAFTVTVDAASGTGFHAAVCADITGHNTSAPIRQQAHNGARINPESSTASGTVTLSSAPVAGNLVVVAFIAGADATGAAAAPTAGAGKTFTAVTNQTQANCHAGLFYRVADGSEATTITCSDLGQTVGNYVAVAFEVAAASSGTTGTATATQAGDTSSGSGKLGYSGAAAGSQASNIGAASGNSGGLVELAQSAGYSFNTGTVSGSTVRDLAGYFLNGTITGSAAITTGKTGYGNALNCTGGGLQVAVTSGTYPINTDGGLTVAAWVKLNTTTSAARCIASGKSGSSLDWALYASNGSGNVSAVIEGTTYSSTTSIRDSNWHHVMLVVDRVFGPGAETVRLVVDGTQVHSSTGLTTGLAYSGNASIFWGRNDFTGTEALDGIIDDARWWNDPVSSGSWAGVVSTEMQDLQLAVYAFDGTCTDLGTHGRDLNKHASASYSPALYGQGLQSTATAAGASGTVNFGDLDRLALTGYVRLDTAPSGSAAPIMAITDTGGTNKFRAVVNTNRTVTLTWVTIYGTFSVTSTNALTVGAWTRFHFNMNPTYVGIRLGSDSQDTTSTGNSDPHLTPTVNDLDVLYVGGDATAGGQVTFDYVNCTQNFLDVPKNNYWTGPANFTSVMPTNTPRLVAEFNENIGTTAADSGPAGNHLTLTSSGGWTTGVQGSALNNDGTDGPGARRTTMTWGSSPTGWSFSGWFKCRAASNGARIIAMRNSGSEVAHVFYLSGAFQLRLYGASGNTGLVSPNGSAFAAETWTHLAAVCNGTTIQFFKNGVHYGSADYTQGALLVPTELNVGGDVADGSGEEVADGVDSLTLFDTPLSRSSVQWLFENPGQLASSTTGTVEVTQGTQTSSASGKLGYSGTSTRTQGAQTSTAAGKLGYTGTAARAQGAQTATASGAVAGASTGTAAVTQAANTAAGAGQLGYSGAAARVQSPQTSSGAGALGYTGTLARIQGNQAAAAVGTFTGSGPVTGVAATTQAANTGAAAGTITNPATGIAAPVQANQTVAAQGILRYTSTAAVTQAANAASAQGVTFIPITGTLAETQASQTSSAAGSSLGAVVIRPNTGTTARPFAGTTHRP